MPMSPASSTTKTDRHDIAEILLKVALSTINQIKSTNILALSIPDESYSRIAWGAWSALDLILRFILLQI